MSVVDNFFITSSGYIGKPPQTSLDFSDYPCLLIDNKIQKIVKIIVHKFEIVTVSEDIAMYAAEPILKWQQSEVGQWVIKNSVESPKWERFSDYSLYIEKFVITAKMSESNATYFSLKWK